MYIRKNQRNYNKYILHITNEQKHSKPIESLSHRVILSSVLLFYVRFIVHDDAITIELYNIMSGLLYMRMQLL